jgi:hypothetical protein
MRHKVRVSASRSLRSLRALRAHKSINQKAETLVLDAFWLRYLYRGGRRESGVSPRSRCYASSLRSLRALRVTRIVNQNVSTTGCVGGRLEGHGPRCPPNFFRWNICTCDRLPHRPLPRIGSIFDRGLPQGRRPVSPNASRCEGRRSIAILSKNSGCFRSFAFPQ